MGEVSKIKGGIAEQKHSPNVEPSKPITFSKAKKVVKTIAKEAKSLFQPVSLTLTVLKEAHVLPVEENPIPTFAIGAVLGAIKGVITVPSSIQSIVENLKKTGLRGSEFVERNLKIASAAASLGCSVLCCVKFGDAIALMATIGLTSKSMGAVKVATITLAPFTVVVAVFEIGQTAMEIAIDVVHIYQTDKKIKALRAKTKLWGGIDWQDASATIPIINRKIDYMETKQVSAKIELVELAEVIQTTEEVYERRMAKFYDKEYRAVRTKIALSERNVIIRIFGQVVPKAEFYRAKSKYKAALKVHTSNIDDFSSITGKYWRRENRITNWRVVEDKMTDGNLSKENIEALDKFKEAQIEKWGIKKSNYKLEKLKIGLGIALKTVVIVTLVASIILAFTGYGTIPAIVTMASLTLFITAAEWGLKKFKKYKKPAPWIPGQVPVFPALKTSQVLA